MKNKFIAKIQIKARYRVTFNLNRINWQIKFFPAFGRNQTEFFIMNNWNLDMLLLCNYTVRN